MIRSILAVVATLAATACWAQEGSAYNEELGLPYWAPGRGEVDHEALRRRSLAVLEGQYSAFAGATKDFAEATQDYCNAEISREEIINGFENVWLTWAPLDSYQFGPAEQSGAVLSINFWPDKKNFVGRALKSIMAQPSVAQRSGQAVASGSAAGQGLPAIERLLFTDIPTCPAIIGVSAVLHQTAEQLYDDWFDVDGWADLIRAAGPENPVYLSNEEFTKTLYTALDFGLIRISEQRLGRPMGTYDRTFPKRAEAWRSGLTGRIVSAQLNGFAQMIRSGFAGDLRDPDRAWILELVGQAEGRLAEIPVSISEAVKTPQGRFRVELLQTKIDEIRHALAEDIGPGLGVDTGFSPADGD
ncbi:imelysin family protein [Sulfitobacter donghicola]|uniref:Imelysin-like domain-containing protein n=1 Tax=Sulfitobacter donghicola DSW-25 = KCTC 12864 = JCM 14565 TaxID=1300350 RepID=A0A073IH45_9RHOB|nr:imelysin family protein [Sulfitobacter donghicola]KEJ88880.1 hypothetical protein DSW25_13770 [Sulfitobacter donghicola DSW-25 = KCTC 12864 = JCM 14565]KIN68497.1 Peptidase M75 [Sulfitobacter donghicola DSW-25 = KCTC 12864 = JCM 14565]